MMGKRCIYIVVVGILYRVNGSNIRKQSRFFSSLLFYSLLFSTLLLLTRHDSHAHALGEEDEADLAVLLPKCIVHHDGRKGDPRVVPQIVSGDHLAHAVVDVHGDFRVFCAGVRTKPLG